jgi:HK97 family phage portal protein
VSLFTPRRQARVSTVDGPLFPGRMPSGAKVSPGSITEDNALRHSAVWACLRLRADLMSTFPLDVYRDHDGRRVEMPKPPVLVDPGGEHWDYIDWMYATQVDLDRVGNALGLITERNALNLPSRIDLVSTRDCGLIWRKGMKEHRWRIDNVEYTPQEVWHERQFPVAGLPIGLSPIAYAAWTLAENMSMQQFAVEWFGAGGVPRTHLRNTQKAFTDDVEPRRIKDRYKAALTTGDVFVTGNDWELDMMQAEAMGMEWLEGRSAGVVDIARYFGAPADLIDAIVKAGGNITYANIAQRNLQFLIMHLGAAVTRREKKFSRRLLPQPRYCKLNTDALLRMDPETRDKTIRERIDARTLAPSEARALYDMPPLTPAQIEEFTTLFGPPGKAAKTPAKTGPKGE